MPSGFGGSDLNQLKDKDDIEDDDDPVNLVHIRFPPLPYLSHRAKYCERYLQADTSQVGTRSSDPSDAPLIPEEMQYLSANQRPGGLLSVHFRTPKLNY